MRLKRMKHPELSAEQKYNFVLPIGSTEQHGPFAPFKVNHAPGFTTVADSPDPAKLSASVTFTTTASDPDTDGTADTVTLYVCKSNDFAAGACGAGGTWCSSTASASNPSCSYTVLVGDGDSAHNYYAYIIDSHSFESTSNPRSSTFTTDVTAPTMSTLSPADNAESSDVTTNLVITFSEAVDAETGNIILYQTGDTVIQTFDVTADISGSGTTTITLNPTADLSGGTGYYIKVDATAFDDIASNSYAGITDATTWSFTTQSTGRRRTTATTVGGETSTTVEQSTTTPTTGTSTIGTALDTTINTTPATMTTDTATTASERTTTAVIPTDGQLIKYPDSPKVYLVENGELRWITDAETFEARGYDWNTIQTIGSTINLPLGETVVNDVVSYEGKLIKYINSTAVYLVQNSLKQWIVDEAAFNHYGYDWNAIVTISDGTAFADGKNIVKPIGYIFTRDFSTGAIGEDVKELQKFLNRNGFPLAASGPGSSGNETTLFGRLTRLALIKFQQANDILPANGYFGSTTRVEVNK